MSVAPVKCCLYVRVSTQDQNCELQLRALHEYADQRGWQIAETYQDVMSGAKERRPGFDRLLKDARAGRFDCVLVWKLDRFGRSLRDCLNNLELLQSAGVRFIATTQGIDTDQQNPAARFYIQLLGAAAEFERSLIVERTQAGRIRYEQDFEAGKVGRTVHSKSGKDLPPHRPKKIFDRQKVIDLYAQYGSLRRVAREMRLGIGTVQRIVKARSKSQLLEMDGHPTRERDLTAADSGAQACPNSLN